MADATGQKSCSILKEVEMREETIQKLVKGHGQEKDLQGPGDQVCDNSKSDKCGNSSSLSNISHHIDINHQVIYEKNPDFQLSPATFDQQSMVNQTKEVSVVDTSSIDKALNNNVVLRTIMQHLDTKDLFNVRLVAKKWEDEATVQLLTTRKNHEVKFSWHRKEFKFRSNAGTLEEFADSCYGKIRRKFPCSQLFFTGSQPTKLEVNEAELQAADFLKFFSKCGHHVKSLWMYSPYESVLPLEILRKIVFEWTPNLKSLTIIDVPVLDEENEDEPPTREIENTSKLSAVDGLKCSKLSLEHFEIYNILLHDISATAQHWRLLITDILSSAPNLKTISDEKLRYTKEIISTGKISAVHHLAWEVYDEHRMTRCIEFSQARPTLTDLEVDGLLVFQDPPSNCLPGLQLVLQSSRETLRTLKFDGRFDLLYGASRMNLPVMENLQKLCIESWSSVGRGQGRLLPEGFSLQKLFPRLKSLTLKDVGDKTRNQEDNPFGQSCNSSTTLEELTIGTSWGHYRFHADWLRQARDLYPNVRVLKLDLQYKGWNEVPEICRTIWRSWNESCLEEFSMLLRFPDSKDCATEIMDQALTGFDQETCRMLQKRKYGEEKLERGPSIVDMKKLKYFQLSTNPRISTLPLLSRVAVIHALEPMGRSQDLRVTINGVKLTDMLQNGSYLDFSVPDCGINIDE